MLTNTTTASIRRTEVALLLTATVALIVYVVSASIWSPKQRIVRAVFSGNDAVVQEILASGDVDINARVDVAGYADLQNTTLLMIACRNSHCQVVRTLVNGGAAVDARDVDAGRTALRYAVRTHKANHAHVAECIRLLHEAGADINSQDAHGQTALHVAAGRGWLDIVAVLLAHGADPDLRDCDGKAPADIAQDGGHNNVSEWLRFISTSNPIRLP